MSEPSLPEKVVALDAALDTADIDHAFGGALALAYYAEPRVTIDIDLNVFASPDSHGQVHEAIGQLGVDPAGTESAIERDGQARWWWGRTPVDLFFANDPIHAAMASAVRRVPFGDSSIPILSPEHLVVCKVMFNRPKDWLDIEQVLVATPDLDIEEVDTWLDRTLASDDHRSRRFHELADRQCRRS